MVHLTGLFGTARRYSHPGDKFEDRLGALDRHSRNSKTATWSSRIINEAIFTAPMSRAQLSKIQDKLSQRMSLRRKPVQEDLRSAEASNPEPFEGRSAGAKLPDISQKRTADQIGDRDRDADDLAPALAYIAINDGSDSELESHRDIASDRLRDSGIGHAPVSQSNLDKPLPKSPDVADERQVVSERGVLGAKAETHIRSDSARELGVEGILDLRNTEDTSYHRQQAPAVTHETIEQPVHEIKHEVLEREVHEHHIHHRILPVNEVEVLPARHFVQDVHGRRHEVRKDQIPGRVPRSYQQMFSAQGGGTSSPESGALKARHFTARQFAGNEGDFQESRGANGAVQTERWWVHPPTLQQPDSEAGDVYPVQVEGCGCHTERP